MRSLCPGPAEPCTSSSSRVLAGSCARPSQQATPRRGLLVVRCNTDNGAGKRASTATGAASLSTASASTSGEVLQPAASPAAQVVQAPKMTGVEVEAAAMRLAVAKHEAQRAGNIGPVQTTDSAKRFDGKQMATAYERCGFLTAEYAKTFYLGTQLMSPEKARAIWAIYVWCRRTDELVDGPNAARVTPAVLDRWEERLEETFEGRPYDVLDAALADTVHQFPVDVTSFRDMVEGMRMDLVKPRYATFDELYEYCYRVAGAVGLMTTPIMGIDPKYTGPLEPVYQAALSLGTANQLTNILRDVGEDAQQRNRIYLPTDELKEYGLTESGMLNNEYLLADGSVDERWQNFMKFQIRRARDYFAAAEAGVVHLDPAARWPVWSALILYRMILDGIEKNGYNNFTKRAYVPKWQKLALLPVAFSKAL